MTKFRYTMFVVTVIVALALSAMITAPVLADDSTPPPTETPMAETPPPTDLPPVEITPTVEVTEVVPPPAGDVVPAEEAAPQESTEAGLLASIPEGTELVVLDEAGNPLPLATVEAENAIEFRDPIWCPAGVAPNPLNPACSPNAGSLSALLADASGSPYTNGTIWIQWGDDLGSAAIIDGFVGLWAGSSAYSLTLQGGWQGTPGSAALHTADPYSYFDTRIYIDWAGAVTLNNIVFNGVTSGDALTILTEKNITLNNVDVVDNTGGDGAILNNTFGTGNIVVNDSTFNGNNGYGLSVYSNGTITAKNLSANNNFGGGAWIDNSYASTAKAVTLTGTNNFKFNEFDGLVVYSQGAITLSNVTAIYNAGGSGVEVDNCDYDGSSWCNQTFASAVTIKGASNFSDNGWDGLRVWSSGAITLGNITANNNGTDPARPAATDNTPPGVTPDAYGKGVFLHNYGSWSAKAITLTGTNNFNGNASTGIYAQGWGAINVNNLTANDNGCDPLKESAAWCDGANLDGSGVTLSGYGVFNGNYDDGMEVESYGVITLNNLYAENNGWWGVGIDSYGPAAAVNVLGTSTFINNADNGLNIWSYGAVTLNNITANGNDVDGVYVDNAWKWVWDPILMDSVQVLAGKPITLKGSNFFNENTGYGLEMYSSGIITTNNITALFNVGSGVHLDNCLYDADPLVEDCTGLVGKAVTMNGNNNINGNGGIGLHVESLGAIKANNLTASDNGDKGVILDNNWTKAIGTVTITGFANTSGNGGIGLGIYSPGAITLSNVTANGNGHRGAMIFNAFNPLKPSNVTLLGVNQFNDNWYTGLRINTYGVVLLNNITANGNGDPTDPAPNMRYGVDIVNSNGTIVKAVTLNGINIFNENYDDGLSIQSKGAIVVNKVTAKGNGVNGASLNNQFGTVNSVITLIGYGTFTGNGGDGLFALSHGAITATNLAANFNLGNGAWLENDSATITPVTVTLLGNSFFNNNQGIDGGLIVFSDGQITLNNVTANNNSNGDGAYLDNVTNGSPFVPRGITLLGTNTFVNNYYDGLYFEATGNVILTRIIADFNDGYGNAYTGSGVLGITAGTITLTCGSMNLNEGYGYDLTAGVGKLITLKGVFTYGNLLGNFSSAPTVNTRTCALP